MTGLHDSLMDSNDREPLPRRVTDLNAAEPELVAERPADFFSSLVVLGRHWKMVVTGVAITVALALVAVALFPPSFKANGSSILLASPTLTGPEANTKPNAYLGFGGSLKVTTEVMAKVMNGDEMGPQVIARGGIAPYVVDQAPGDAPILTVTATAANPDDALKTERIVSALLAEELVKRETDAGASPESFIVVKDVDVPQRAHKQQTSRIRALIGVMVLGLAATVAAAFLLESIAQHRAARERRGSVSRVEQRVAEVSDVRPLASPRRDQPAPTGDLPVWGGRATWDDRPKPPSSED